MTPLKESPSLKKDTVLVYAGFFIRYLYPLILVPYLGRMLGAESYGQVLAATALMMLVQTIIAFGFYSTGARDLAGAQSQETRNEIYSRQFSGRLLLIPAGLIVGIVGILMSKVLQEHIGFGIIGIATGIVLAFNFSWLFQGMRRFSTSIWTESIVYPINIVLIFMFVKGSDDGLNALLSIFVSNTVSIIIATVVSRRYARVTTLSFLAGFEEIKASLVFFVSSFSYTLMTVGLTYALSIYLTSKEVAYFGVAERFVAMGVMLLAPLGQVLMPTITGLYKDNAIDKALWLARKGFIIELGYSVVACVAGIGLAPYLIPLLLGKEFMPSVPLFQWMICLLPFAAIRHSLFQFMLIPLREEKFYLLTSVLTVMVTFSLMIILVPIWGSMGVVAARVGAEGVATVVLLVSQMRTGLLQKMFR